MDVATAVALTGPICVGIAAFGCGIGLGIAVYGAMGALGRQPSASGKILTTMIIGAALIEALAIYALIVFFILLGRMTPVDNAHASNTNSKSTYIVAESDEESESDEEIKYLENRQIKRIG